MIVYSAEAEMSQWRDVIRAMLRGMMRSRYIAYRLAVKDIKAEYARSAFGMLWDFVDPLVLGLIFYWLAKMRAINPGNLEMPYALYVVYGLLLYQTFCDSLLLSVDSIHRSKVILTHLKLPPEAMILSVFFRVLFNSMFRIAIMLAFSLYMWRQASAQGLHGFSPTGFPLFVVASPLIILAGMSFGFFLAPFHAIYSDVGRVARIILNPLRYLSPVIFSFPATGKALILYYANPVFLVLKDLRLLAVSGEVSNLQGDLVWGGIYVVVFLAGWLVFHLSIPILAERA